MKEKHTYHLRNVTNDYYTLYLPTKPYLNQYLKSLYGSPVYFTVEDYFRKVVTALLERPTRTHGTFVQLKSRIFNEYTDTLELHLPKIEGKKQVLKPGSIICINNLFEERFREDLAKHCELATIYRIERKKAIEEFCFRHLINIEEHISFDALKKKEERFRTRKQKSADLSRDQTRTGTALQKKSAHLSFYDLIARRLSGA